ncbi:MAG: hypothetical protein NZ851_03310 [Aquificaceae bacterium]|nr:hypothetical protein [Aquificaceae bacterium]
MSAKGKFLILRRFRAGDKDLMVKVYGTHGMTRVYVPEGLIAQEGFLGLLEPFNLMHAVCKQSGGVLILKDLIKVDFISYLSLRDYSTYMWMSLLVSFLEKWFLQYDAELFDMAVSYLTLRTKNPEVILLRFKLEFLKRMGLYREEIFEEGLRCITKQLLEEESLKKLERLRIAKSAVSKLEDAIEAHLQGSL